MSVIPAHRGSRPGATHTLVRRRRRGHRLPTRAAWPRSSSSARTPAVAAWMDSAQCAPLGDRRLPSGGPGVPQLKRPRSDSSWNDSFSASQHPRSAVKTCSSTAQGRRSAASGRAWRTASTISLITCQSSIDRLPGNDCSIVSFDLGPNQPCTGSEEDGWIVTVLIIVSLPCLAQTLARSLKKPRLYAIRLPTGLPLRLPD